MAAPDDLEIKDEIEAIADRIDNILKTVKRHYQITENAKNQSETESEQSASTCHDNQTPEQEA